MVQIVVRRLPWETLLWRALMDLCRTSARLVDLLVNLLVMIVLVLIWVDFFSTVFVIATKHWVEVNPRGVWINDHFGFIGLYVYLWAQTIFNAGLVAVTSWYTIRGATIMVEWVAGAFGIALKLDQPAQFLRIVSRVFLAWCFSETIVGTLNDIGPQVVFTITDLIQTTLGYLT